MFFIFFKGRDMDQQIQDMTDFRQDVDNLMLPDPLASSGLSDSTNSAFGKYISTALPHSNRPDKQGSFTPHGHVST